PAVPTRALLLAAALPLRAEQPAPATAPAPFESAAAPAAYPQRSGPNEVGWGPQRRQMQAREGLLLSFGLGGGSTFISSQGPGRTGAFDLDFRVGYGFSDRFQLFMDFAVDSGRYPQSADFASWTFTIRGQTVLIGDRAGNGLNLNVGIGVGGVEYNSTSCCSSY